jgi:hypothetical protein
LADSRSSTTMRCTSTATEVKKLDSWLTCEYIRDAFPLLSKLNLLYCRLDADLLSMSSTSQNRGSDSRFDHRSATSGLIVHPHENPSP